MILIAIVVALALELFVARGHELRSLAWLEGYMRWIRSLFRDSSLWDGPVGVLAVLAPVLLILGLVQWLLAGVWLGLWSLLLGVAVLYYALAYRSLDEAVDQYAEAADAGDGDTAATAGQQILGTAPADEQAGPRRMAEEVLTQSNARLFAAVFWFAVLGPLGALFYRLSWALADRTGRAGQGAEQAGAHEGFVAAAVRLEGILAWIPARLAAIGYALAGSFEDAVHHWRSMDTLAYEDFIDQTDGVLRGVGIGALPIERYTRVAEGGEATDEVEPGAVKAARGLVLRTLVIWVIALALITLAGWAY